MTTHRFEGRAPRRHGRGKRPGLAVVVALHPDDDGAEDEDPATPGRMKRKRRRGGKVDGKKAERRIDKRARGGSVVRRQPGGGVPTPSGMSYLQAPAFRGSGPPVPPPPSSGGSGQGASFGDVLGLTAMAMHDPDSAFNDANSPFFLSGPLTGNAADFTAAEAPEDVVARGGAIGQRRAGGGGVAQRFAFGGSPLGMSLSMASPWWERSEERSADYTPRISGQGDRIAPGPAGAAPIDAGILSGGAANGRLGPSVREAMIRSAVHGAEPPPVRRNRATPEIPPPPRPRENHAGGAVSRAHGGQLQSQLTPRQRSIWEGATHEQRRAAWRSMPPEGRAAILNTETRGGPSAQHRAAGGGMGIERPQQSPEFRREARLRARGIIK